MARLSGRIAPIPAPRLPEARATSLLGCDGRCWPRSGLLRRARNLSPGHGLTDRHLKIVMFACFALAAVGVGLLVYDRARPFREWYLWAFVLAIGLHQLEEYVVTPALLGEKYYFRAWFSWATGMDLTVARAFVYNIPMTYPAAALAAWVGESFILFPLVFVCTEAVNATWHLGMTTSQGRWSPGVVTGVLLYVPAGFYTAWIAVDIGTPWWAVGLAWLAAVGTHFAIVSGIMPKTERHPLVGPGG